MRFALAMLLALVLTATAPAVPGMARSPVILTVGSAAFDRDALERLPQARFDTATPWTKGVNRFEGPLLRDVLAAAGARRTRLTAVALNDYTVAIPAEDADLYRVIVAIKRNGAYMPVRDKGPLWIVYPLDDSKELRTPETHTKMIWQLNAIVFE